MFIKKGRDSETIEIVYKSIFFAKLAFILKLGPHYHSAIALKVV